MNIQVLADVPHVLAIAKPAGIPFHSTPNTSGLLHHVRQCQRTGQIPYQGRLYPVHRLDACTSGICLLAKSSDAASYLIDAFRNRAVQKYYVAISGKKPIRKQGSVIGDMERSRRSTWMLLRSTNNPAVTRFWSTGIPEVRTGLRLYLVKPETGKTHQIRVALKSNSSPILGDLLYANKNDARGEDRTYLHAAALRVCIGDQPLQVLCAPDQGSCFTHPAFQDQWGQLFPSGMGSNLGTWFPDHPLLASQLDCTSSLGAELLGRGADGSGSALRDEGGEEDELISSMPMDDG